MPKDDANKDAGDADEGEGEGNEEEGAADAADEKKEDEQEFQEANKEKDKVKYQPKNENQKRIDELNAEFVKPLDHEENDRDVVAVVEIQKEAILRLNPEQATAAEEEENSKSSGFLKHEDEMVVEMLDKFLIVSESAFLDTINLQLMLKAMPTDITKTKARRTHMFHFNVLEDSLTKNLNAEQSEAFSYYDNQNVDRVQKIRESIAQQKANLERVQSNMNEIKRLADKNDNIITDFNNLHEEFRIARQKKEDEIKAAELARQQSDTIGSADKRKRKKKR